MGVARFDLTPLLRVEYLEGAGGESGAFSLCILPHANRLHCAGELM
jgi:hypothetical protein